MNWRMYLKEVFAKQSKELKRIGQFALLSTAICLTAWLAAPGERLPEAEAQTVIPEGMILVPIDILNLDSVDSMVGEQSVVDLFQLFENSRVRKVAEGVTLLRAPLNPRQFGVLVPDSEVSTIAGERSFQVALRSPSGGRRMVFPKVPGKSSKPKVKVAKIQTLDISEVNDAP